MNLTVLKASKALMFSDKSSLIDYTYFVENKPRNCTDKVCFADFVHNNRANTTDTGLFLIVNLFDARGKTSDIIKGGYTSSFFLFTSKKVNNINRKLFKEIGVRYVIKNISKDKVSIRFYFIDKNKQFSNRKERVFYSTITRVLFEGNYKLVPNMMLKLKKINKSYTYFQLYQWAIIELFNIKEFYFNTWHSIVPKLYLELPIISNRRDDAIILWSTKRFYPVEEFKIKFVFSGDSSIVSKTYKDSCEKITFSFAKTCEIFKIEYDSFNVSSFIEARDKLQKNYNEVYHLILSKL